MGISVQCAACNHAMRVPDGYAGKRGKCPKCMAVVQVPAISDQVTIAVPRNPPTASKPSAAHTAHRRSDEQSKAVAPSNDRPLDPAALVRALDTAFKGPIESVRRSMSYRAGILVVAAVMLVLPLIYVGLIVLVVCLVYSHAVNDVEMIGAVRPGRAMIALALAYTAPIIAGAILVFFMIKPLFAAPARPQRTRALTRRGEPVLFAFVDRLCEIVGAPAPTRILVCCNVNAGAGFAGRPLRPFAGGLTLTIGVPLVAGLKMNQFAGVLAHELGHFTQGAGMRVTFVTRSISAWFMRVVYERDAWDEWLEDTAESLDLRVGWILHLSRLGVWISRRVLWVLMKIGHVVSSSMLRQMEYDADRHEGRLVGADVFAATTRRLQELDISHQLALIELNQFMAQGTLPDDVPDLVQRNSARLPAELVQKLISFLADQPTSWFDTHPSNRDRIASVNRDSPHPVFAVSRPATWLFADFKTLSRNVTWDLYSTAFGARFAPQNMRDVTGLFPAGSQPQTEPSNYVGPAAASSDDVYGLQAEEK